MPQEGQKRLPLTALPHSGHMPSVGFFLPHSGQNFPVFTEPQVQVQLSITGFFEPQLEQNFPDSTEPQAQVHVSDFGASFGASALALASASI